MARGAAAADAGTANRLDQENCARKGGPPAEKDAFLTPIEKDFKRTGLAQAGRGRTQPLSSGKKKKKSAVLLAFTTNPEGFIWHQILRIFYLKYKPIIEKNVFKAPPVIWTNKAVGEIAVLPQPS